MNKYTIWAVAGALLLSSCASSNGQRPQLSRAAHTHSQSKPKCITVSNNGGKALVAGGGGSRAVLGSAGVIYACKKAGIKNWQSIGGVSGGALPTALLASGMSAEQIVCLAVDSDFSTLLTHRHTDIGRLAYTGIFFKLFETTRPRSYLLSSERVGEFIDRKIKRWPANYWTMAVAGKHQILFTAKGVFVCAVDGSCVQISDKPVSLAEAIRASMAVPGVIEPRYLNGVQLSDGVLSWDGACPIGLPVRVLGAKPEHVIACHVGEQKRSFNPLKLLTGAWDKLLGIGYPWSDAEADPNRWAKSGTVLVKPDLKFSAMNLNLTDTQKWDAVLSAFKGTITELYKKSLISKEKFAELEKLASNRQQFISGIKSN